MTTLATLQNNPPWDWPEDADQTLLNMLRNGKTAPPDMLAAAELAGDYTVINDELAKELLGILRDASRDEELRGKAAISLGPILEHADMYGFDDPDDVPIDEETYDMLVEALETFYADNNQPDLVRRRVLEAAVRAPRNWQNDAIRAAWARPESEWKQTAAFGMAYLDGFEEQIMEGLENKDQLVHAECLCAAGNEAVAAAWPHVAALLKTKGTDKQLLLAAIDAAASINPEAAIDLLEPLTTSNDEEIAEAAEEAIATADEFVAEDEEEEEEDFEDEADE